MPNSVPHYQVTVYAPPETGTNHPGGTIAKTGFPTWLSNVGKTVMDRDMKDLMVGGWAQRSCVLSAWSSTPPIRTLQQNGQGEPSPQ